MYIPVLADFVLSTWLVDRLEVAPYLSVVGLPQSGKTTLLKILSLLCRRSLLISDITPASFFRACAQFNSTLLIDEAGSIANNRNLRHILCAGSARNVDSVQANHTFHAYGSKVLSWLEEPDDTALNSRCILIPMRESMDTDLMRSSDVKVEREAAELQAYLLQYRFVNYRRVIVRPISGDEVLRPRSRDLLRALAVTHIGNYMRSDMLLDFFKSGHAVAQEPLSPEQNAVLCALYSFIHKWKEFGCLTTGELTNMVNDYFEGSGERLRLKPRKVGAVLTSLGFTDRSRTKSGWEISMNRKDAEKLHELADHYGLDNLDLRSLKFSPDECHLCEELVARKCNRAPRYPK